MEMKHIFSVVLCLFFVTPVMAAMATQNKAVKDDNGAEIFIPEKECQYLTAYQPAPGVEYQPGVDVHGKPVMEADVTPSVIKPPEKYSFDITVEVARYMGLSVPDGVFGEMKVGTITVDKGQMLFNGNPVEGDAEAALKTICATQKIQKVIEKPQQKAPVKKR